MSFGHEEGNTTVVHAFADPYDETQLFNPTPRCAPGGTSGKLSVDYHFTTRPGVKITERAVDDIGCAQFTATVGSSYVPQTWSPRAAWSPGAC